MNIDRIEQLLEKYWLCETTVQEEEELRGFFEGDDIPMHLIKYKALFGLKQEELETGLDESFDRRILEMIGKEQKPQRRFTFSPILQVAASIAVILTLWFSIHLYTESQNDPWKQDTYQTPEQAMAEMQKVLAIVSGQIERGQDLVIQKMEKAEPLTDIIKQ